MPATREITSALVTGTGGFVASTLAEDLLERGVAVRGVEALNSYYAEDLKRANLASVEATARRTGSSFSDVRADLADADLAPLLDGVDTVFHLAGQPGVRSSWDRAFSGYLRDNVEATHRLLDAARGRGLKLVYASSSSVYGDVPYYPTREDDPTRPASPYGVTKLSGELLAMAYGKAFDLDTTALRYFTVYGPRQRPDMAFARVIASALGGRRFTLYGDGSQIRDFTFVRDVVAATRLAGETETPGGRVLNVSSGANASMAEALDVLAGLLGRDLDVQRVDRPAGDVLRTGGSSDQASRVLGWHPTTALRDGLAAQLEWYSGLDDSLREGYLGQL